jgi:hypothetical protein
MQACADGHDRLALRLLQLRHLSKPNGDAIIHRKNIHGMTTLMQASESGNPKVVKMLLIALQLLLKSIKPETLAANNVDIPSQLNRADNPRGCTDLSASINPADYHGNTALIKASKNGHTAVVNQLLHALADTDKRSTMNHMNTYGLTALKIACDEFRKRALRCGGQQFIDIAYTLLEHGCCIDSLDTNLLAYMITQARELNPNPFSGESQDKKILSIINNTDTDWVTEAFFDFANKNAREIRQLHALMKWAILFGQADLVTKMRGFAKGMLTEQGTIQHLYWALKADKFPVAYAVIAHLDQDHKLAIMQAVFTRLSQEHFTSTQAQFTLYLHSTCQAVLSDSMASMALSAPHSPSLFDASAEGAAMSQDNNNMP